MAELTLDALAKRYGDATIVKGASLTVAQGEFLSLLGPSGCGKTTILRMVAGLVEPSAGRILIGGRDVTAVPPNHRGIGLVFQSYALFPHMTVYENVAFGLRRQKVRGTELDARVRDALDRVRLPQLADRMPRQLSGGQQQRVAIARALAPRPGLMLFDEPLSNLDAQLRDEMQIELKRIQRDTGITTVFVTHDQAEALSLSDRICVLAHGEVQQIGPPEEVYRRPANGFVAGFIGKPNRLAGTVADRDGAGGRVRIVDGPTIRAARVEGAPGAGVDVVVRQEAIRLVPPGTSDAVPATVVLRSFTGARVQYVARLGDGAAELVLETPSGGGGPEVAVGQEVALALDPADVFVMPAAGGRPAP